jgi:hypothetical protein
MARTDVRFVAERDGTSDIVDTRFRAEATFSSHGDVPRPLQGLP